MPAIGEISGNAKWNGQSWDRLSPTELAAQQPANNGPNITPSYNPDITYSEIGGGTQTLPSGGRFGMNPTTDYTQQLANLAKTAGVNGEVVNEPNDRGFSSQRNGVLVNGNLIDPGFLKMAQGAATNPDGSWNQDYFNTVVRDGVGSLGVGGTDTNEYENKTAAGQPLTQSTGRANGTYTPIPKNGQYGDTSLGYNPATPAPKSPYGAQIPTSGGGSLGGTSGAVRPTGAGYGASIPGSAATASTPRATGPLMRSSYQAPSLGTQNGGHIDGSQGLTTHRYNSPFNSTPPRTGGAYR